MDDLENELFQMDQERYCAAMNEYEMELVESKKDIAQLKEALTEANRELKLLKQEISRMYDKAYEADMKIHQLEVENTRLHNVRDEMVDTIEYCEEKNKNLEAQVHNEQLFAGRLKWALEGFLFDQDLQEALRNNEEDSQVDLFMHDWSM